MYSTEKRHTTLVLIFVKFHNFSGILRKYQTNPNGGTFYKIPYQLLFKTGEFVKDKKILRYVIDWRILIRCNINMQHGASIGFWNRNSKRTLVAKLNKQSDCSLTYQTEWILISFFNKCIIVCTILREIRRMIYENMMSYLHNFYVNCRNLKLIIHKVIVPFAFLLPEMV